MTRRSRTTVPAAALGTALILIAAACSSSSKTTPPTTLAAGTGSLATSSSTSATRGSGPVDVLYAGSLVTLMNKSISPGFQSATGYTFAGVSGDSGSLANEIKGRTQQGDVFISASAAKDELLEGPANGDWVSWYATFATSNLVLGYNPHSRFAADLRSKPWYQVITEPGFLLGRTDPATDPKGALTVTALNDAASADGASTRAIESSTSNVFPETTLVGRLQAGQLDAGFFYAVEAASAGLRTIPLTGVPTLAAKYTVTVLNNAPHPAGAAAFVRYLLGAAAKQALNGEGLTVQSPATVSGTAPADLQAVLSGR